MLLGKRLFPYPVLNNEKVLSQYKESSAFSVEYQWTPKDDEYVFEGARYILTNDYLQSLIDEDKAKAVLFVECSATRFRKTYVLSKEPKNISIPLYDLNDKITVSGYIIATQDIDPFSPTDLLSFYDEFDGFSVEKHDVLAIDEYARIKINYTVDDDNLTSSIFTIVGDSEITDGSVSVEVTKKKIKISMSKANYNSYVGIKDRDVTKWMPFAIILVPALSSAFEKAKEKGRIPLDDISFEYDWFMSVLSRFKKMEEREMTEDDFYDTQSFVLAQKLLDWSTSKAIDMTFDLISNSEIV